MERFERSDAYGRLTLQLLRAPLTFGLSIPITLLAGPTAGMTSWLLLVAFAVAITRTHADVVNDASLPAAARDR